MSRSNRKLKLHLLFLIYSLTGVISKVVSRYPFLSVPFCAGYISIILIMAGFTIVWQKILQKETLSNVYMYKAMTVIWGNVFGIVIFKERISLLACAGMGLILIGMYLIGSTGENKESGDRI